MVIVIFYCVCELILVILFSLPTNTQELRRARTYLYLPLPMLSLAIYIAVILGSILWGVLSGCLILGVVFCLKKQLYNYILKIKERENNGITSVPGAEKGPEIGNRDYWLYKKQTKKWAIMTEKQKEEWKNALEKVTIPFPNMWMVVVCVIIGLASGIVVRTLAQT